MPALAFSPLAATRPRAASLVAAIVLVCGSALVAAPAHASAAVTKSGDTLHVTRTTPGQFLIEPSDGDGFRILSDDGFSSHSGCGEDMYGSIVCPGITRVVITGSTGGDFISIDGPLLAEVRGGAGDDLIDAYDDVSLTAYGESGNDEIYGGTGPNTLDGGDGHDEVHGNEGSDTVTGGNGNDRLSGGWGDDTLSGGPGNDRVIGDHAAGVQQPQDGDDVLDGGDGDDVLQGMGGADSYRGGPGSDRATYEGQYADDSGMTFAATLDGVTNDGVTGEGDNISADGGVEHMTLPTSGVDHMTVVGNDLPNSIDAHAQLTMVADGGGGDDSLLVSAVGVGGVATVAGGAGNDSISSYGETSTVDGGPGNDTIYSGKGNDSVTGGPGLDSIDAGYGNDVIDTVDAEVDSVSCGIGGDILRADAIDAVNQDPLALCEATTVVGTAPTSPTTTPTSSAPISAVSGQVTVRAKKKVRVSRKGVAKFRASNAMAVPVRIKAVAKGKGFKVATGKVSLAAGDDGRLKMRLTRKAVKHLRRHGGITARVTFRLVEGATGSFRKKVRFVMR